MELPRMLGSGMQRMTGAHRVILVLCALIAACGTGGTPVPSSTTSYANAKQAFEGSRTAASEANSFLKTEAVTAALPGQSPWASQCVDRGCHFQSAPGVGYGTIYCSATYLVFYVGSGSVPSQAAKVVAGLRGDGWSVSDGGGDRYRMPENLEPPKA